MLNDKQESCEYQLLKSVGLTRRAIKLWYTDYEANALTTEPRAGWVVLTKAAKLRSHRMKSLFHHCIVFASSQRAKWEKMLQSIGFAEKYVHTGCLAIKIALFKIQLNS